MRYFGDGSGRDSYIQREHGGLVKSYKAMAAFHLKDFLRKDKDNIYESESQLQFYNRSRYPSQDSFVSPGYITKREIQGSKEKAKIQNNSIKNLYYAEKRKKNLSVVENIDYNIGKIDKMIKKEERKNSVFIEEERDKLKAKNFEDRKLKKNLSCYIFPHLKRTNLHDKTSFDNGQEFIEDVSGKLNNFKSFAIRKKKLKQIIHNCHNIDSILGD